MRLFIGIDLPEYLKQAIYKWIEPELRRHPELKWVSLENFHFTLKFLGEVSEYKIEQIKDRLKEVADENRRFKVRLGEMGYFKNRGYLRVLWLGVEEGGDSIIKIYTEIEKEMAKLGFNREKRDFTPHITLARPKREGKTLPSTLELKPPNLPDFFAEEVVLFRSQLTPKGAVYEKIGVFPLKNE